MVSSCLLACSLSLSHTQTHTHTHRSSLASKKVINLSRCCCGYRPCLHLPFTTKPLHKCQVIYMFPHPHDSLPPTWYSIPHISTETGRSHFISWNLCDKSFCSLQGSRCDLLHLYLCSGSPRPGSPHHLPAFPWLLTLFSLYGLPWESHQLSQYQLWESDLSAEDQRSIPSPLSSHDVLLLFQM